MLNHNQHMEEPKGLIYDEGLPEDDPPLEPPTPELPGEIFLEPAHTLKPPRDIFHEPVPKTERGLSGNQQ